MFFQELERLQSVANVLRGNVPAHYQLLDICASLCTTAQELLEAVRVSIAKACNDTDTLDKIP